MGSSSAVAFASTAVNAATTTPVGTATASTPALPTSLPTSTPIPATSPYALTVPVTSGTGSGSGASPGQVQISFCFLQTAVMGTSTRVGVSNSVECQDAPVSWSMAAGFYDPNLYAERSKAGYSPSGGWGWGTTAGGGTPGKCYVTVCLDVVNADGGVGSGRTPPIGPV